MQHREEELVTIYFTNSTDHFKNIVTLMLPGFHKRLEKVYFNRLKSYILFQGFSTPGPETGTSLWPIRNWTAKM